MDMVVYYDDTPGAQAVYVTLDDGDSGVVMVDAESGTASDVDQVPRAAVLMLTRAQHAKDHAARRDPDDGWGGLLHLNA
jgi:hypothetical protein